MAARITRQEMKRGGLPDTNSPEFIEQARRDSLAIARSVHAREDQDFLDSISILPSLPEFRWQPMKRGEIRTVVGGSYSTPKPRPIDLRPSVLSAAKVFSPPK